MSLEVVKCGVCARKKTALKCDLCHEPSCKLCSSFIDEEHFELLSLLPEDLRNKVYCPYCYDDKIAERMKSFDELMDKARDVDVYMKVQSKETRLMRRISKPVKVIDCEDREEALLRLAYLAAENGFNAIVDVELVSKKSPLPGSYKKLVWDGRALPVDPKQKK